MWAKNRTEVCVFPKEAATAGLLSLPGGNLCVPLLAPPGRSGEDLSLECQPQAGGLSREAVFEDVSQSTKAAAMNRGISRENRSLWPDTASLSKGNLRRGNSCLHVSRVRDRQEKARGAVKEVLHLCHPRSVNPD